MRSRVIRGVLFNSVKKYCTGVLGDVIHLCHLMKGLPFTVEIQSGKPAYEQVIHAVHRALVDGRLQPGDAFPSVRAMSKAIRINPNTCHKVVQRLVSDGVLEVLPGRGTRIAPTTKQSLGQRLEMIEEEVEALVIKANRVGFTEEELQEAIKQVWARICK